VASEFLSEGTFSYEVDRDGERKDQLIPEGGLAVEELPMVVIVNGATGSMAEAVAGALQEVGRATVLGMTTLGDGSTRVYQLLSDGSAIYLPVSLWYTPSGKLIRRNGIEPDITVELTIEDRAAGVDSQLTRAYDHLDDQLPEFR
jgi:carboxyl-terminal processing protease